MKILSSNSPSFFSARQIHARLSLSLFLTNHLRARTHYVRFFSGSTISEGGGRGDLSLGKRDPRIRGKTWMNGVKIWDIVRGPVFEGFRNGGSRKRRATLYLFSRSVPGARHTLTVSTNFTPNFQLARTPPDLHNILEIFYKISSLPPPFLRPSPSLARAQLPTPL